MLSIPDYTSRRASGIVPVTRMPSDGDSQQVFSMLLRDAEASQL